MSNFLCNKCGKEILDSPTGYITGCEHYPLEKTNKSEESCLSCIHFRSWYDIFDHDPDEPDNCGECQRDMNNVLLELEDHTTIGEYCCCNYYKGSL